MDLLNELERLRHQLNASISRLKDNGVELAKAEREYKIELSKKVLQYRQEGTAVTLIDLIIYGDKSVAELRFKRDVADTVYKTNLEHINSTKLQIRILENQISREWDNSKNMI